MILSHKFDSNYDPAIDNSDIVCPGSDVLGPIKPKYHDDNRNWSPWSGGVKASLFENFFKVAFDKNIDFDTDPLKVMLLTNDYAHNPEYKYKTDINPKHEVAGKGYTAGGIQLSSVTINYNSKTNTISVDAADVYWPESHFTARHAIVYSAIKPYHLITHINFGTNVSCLNGGTFTIAWDSAGIFTQTAS